MKFTENSSAFHQSNQSHGTVREPKEHIQTFQGANRASSNAKQSSADSGHELAIGSVAKNGENDHVTNKIDQLIVMQIF